GGTLLRFGVVGRMQPKLRTRPHEPLRATQPSHRACRSASCSCGHESLEAFQPNRFADLNARNQTASVALQTNNGGAEGAGFREELLAVLSVEAAFHDHQRRLALTSRFDGNAGGIRRARRQPRATESQGSHPILPSPLLRLRPSY